MDIPNLELSFGQVAWSLSFGEQPKQYLIDKLNYLRQLGIPFPREKRALGSGNPVGYSYSDLVECGVAIYAIKNGMKPTDIVKVIVGERANMHALYEQALNEQPVACLTSDWVKSKGKIIPMLANDISLRLHDRYSETPLKVEPIGFNPSSNQNISSPFDLIEHFGSSQERLVPLTKLAIQWLYWAQQAPVFKTGPKE